MNRVEYIQHINYITNCDSLDRIIQHDTDPSDSTVGEFVEDINSNLEQSVINGERKQLLLRIMKECLEPREFLVLYKRYGFEDSQSYTLDEIGKTLNVTRERIRQVEAKALAKLKRRLIKLNLKEGDL